MPTSLTATHRHPAAAGAPERRLRLVGTPRPVRAATVVALAILVATVALILLRPDVSDVSAAALALVGVGVAAVAAGASALELQRRRRIMHSEVGWVTRALEQGGRLRSMVESLHEGLIFYDRQMRIIEFNPAAAKIMGLAEDVKGQVSTQLPGWAAIHEDGSEWPVDTHPVAVTLHTGRPCLEVVMGVVRPDMPLLWLRLSSQPVRGADGAVEGVLLTFADISEHRAAEEALRSSELRNVEASEALHWQAFHDPLTGLANRAMLLDRITSAVSRRGEHGLTALLFLDLDRFKNVNDTLGHEAGDHLLVEVAQRLQAALRPSDLVARLGGDEFVVLIESLGSRDEASQLADRIRAAVSRPITLGSSVITITTSVGIAFDVDHRATTLLRDADTALYKAKDHGRDRWEIFDDSLRAATIRRGGAEQLIRHALDEDGLRVHYQPIVDLVTEQVVGAEALLRMVGPHGELLMPSSFVSIAEETGLIVPVGAGVLDDACRQLVGWRKELGTIAPPTVSVNLAARQLSTGGFVEMVERVLDQHGVVPGDLTLELTESTLIEAGRHALDTLHGLHELGVRIAIDDFGTGYSSLSYLKRFPVDTVKVDRSFVEGLGTVASDTEIVRAVLALGQALGLTTVAEGVETTDQLSTLRELGCDVAQGYFFSRPVPADRMSEAMAQVQETMQRT